MVQGKKEEVRQSEDIREGDGISMESLPLFTNLENISFEMDFIFSFCFLYVHFDPQSKITLLLIIDNPWSLVKFR